MMKLITRVGKRGGFGMVALPVLSENVLLSNEINGFLGLIGEKAWRGQAFSC
jgi:hypothetical protein